MSPTFSRRSILSSAAFGLPAAAVGGALLGRSGLAFGAPKAAAGSKPKLQIAGPAGAASINGDYLLPKALRPVAELVLQKARHAFATASANPTSKFGKHRLASASAAFVSTLSSARGSRAKGRASALLSSSSAKTAAAFGHYKAMTPKDYAAKPTKDVPLAEKIKAVPKWELVGVDPVDTSKAKVKKEKPKKHDPDDYAAKPRYERLEFHLNTVKCVEDTNEFDSDEILMGGHLIRPDGGVKKLSSFEVGKDFDKGEIVIYDSAACDGLSSAAAKALEDIGACNGTRSDPYRGKTMVATGLDGPWPGTFALVLLMVEEDYGGFNDLLKQLYAATKEELDELISEAGAAAGAALGGRIGEVIGQVAAWIVSHLVEWLVGLLDTVDDPIATKSWIVTLPDRTKESIDALAAGGLSAPSGIRASAMKQIDFVGDGGRYRTRMHWRATP